ncbi:Hypothetical protein FKW44_012498 [Caligus rogercresseyi]|uniref:Uncharacterized protein n=1 Tax=Caligus rogercresseyi TaxID=217165 RepID=A0A7T8HJT3_CALRO|nr:Hypothetical protein FKW44_012498 [Caligus rogercresseyi]
MELTLFIVLTHLIVFSGAQDVNGDSQNLWFSLFDCNSFFGCLGQIQRILGTRLNLDLFRIISRILERESKRRSMERSLQMKRVKFRRNLRQTEVMKRQMEIENKKLEDLDKRLRSFKTP